MNMNDLPSSLIMFILCNLSIKSIFNCRLVSKTWRDIISEPYFSHLYSKHGPTVLILRQEEKTHESKKGCVVTPPTQQFDFPEVSVYQCYNVLGSVNLVAMNSCHGFACLWKYEMNNYSTYVLNLLKGEFAKLPINVNSQGKYSFYGFGYSNPGNSYKILQLIKPLFDGDPIRAHVYTFGSGAWRDIGSTPYRPLSPCTYLNGAMHWITNSRPSMKKSFRFIFTFDVGMELFGTISLPNDTKKDRSICFGNLGVLDDCLYASGRDVVVFHPDVEIWVMEKYGVKESWVKKFRIRDLSMEWWNLESELQVIRVLGSGELLLVLCGMRCLYIYDLRNRSYSPLLGSIWKSISAHIPGFASLKDVMSEADGQVSKMTWYPVDVDSKREKDDPTGQVHTIFLQNYNICCE